MIVIGSKAPPFIVMGLCGSCGLPVRIITHDHIAEVRSIPAYTHPYSHPSFLSVWNILPRAAGNNLNALYYLFEHMSMELIYLFTPAIINKKFRIEMQNGNKIGALAAVNELGGCWEEKPGKRAENRFGKGGGAVKGEGLMPQRWQRVADVN